jgi:hypothetical protein
MLLKYDTKCLIAIERYIVLQTMNKTSRKRGGRAWNDPPKEFGATLRLINMLSPVIDNLDVTLPTVPEYSNNFEPEFLFNAYSLEMKHLENVLSMVQEELARDILEYSPSYADQNLDALIEDLKTRNIRLFVPEVIVKGGINDFHRCMSRFDSLRNFYYLLKYLVFNWEQQQRDYKTFVRENKSKEKFFPLYAKASEWKKWNDFELIKINSEGRIKLALSGAIETLENIEIDRIRVCPRCEKIFWAGRINMVGCSECSPALKNKKWRDSVSAKQKDEYNKNRSDKRKLNQPQNLEENDLDSSEELEFSELIPPSETELPDEYKTRKVGDIFLENGKEREIVEVRQNMYTSKEVERGKGATLTKIFRKILKGNK